MQCYFPLHACAAQILCPYPTKTIASCIVEVSEKKILTFGGLRNPPGFAGVFGRCILFTIPFSAVCFILNLTDSFGYPIWSEQYFGFFLALILGGTFIYKPATAAPGDDVPWYDWILCFAGIAVGGQIAIRYPDLIVSAFDPVSAWSGLLLLLLLLEATRRFFSWTIVIIAAIFVLYARFAYLAPPPLTLSGVEWDRLLTYIYTDTGAVLGAPIAIASTTALVFVLFGEVLSRSGGASFIQRFSMRLTGGFVGGGAKVSVVSSGLMGSISGSVISNVMITGQVSIPIMRASGYSRAQAAAVEAVASTGGAIMPPIMGAAAFIMADFIGRPYGEIARAAIIPALLYYFCVFCQVDLIARRDGLKPVLDTTSTAGLLNLVGREGWPFIAPFGVLVFLLFFGTMQAQTAGVWATGVAFLSLLLRVRAEIFSAFAELLVGAGKVMLNLGVVCAVSGVIVGAITVSGFGFQLSYVLVSVGQQSLLILAVLVAVVSMILGMGMPATAVYVLLATLVAPAMVEVGASALAAHLFVFYFGLMSLITPPICLAVFAAATLSGSSPWATGFEAFKLAIVAYIVPFVFLFDPALIGQGSPSQIIITVGLSLVGTFVLSVGVAAYFVTRLGVLARISALAGGLLCLLPPGSSIVGLRSDLLGLIIVAVFVGLALRRLSLSKSLTKPEHIKS